MLTIRASELGSCLKAQVAVHLGYSPLPVPEKMQAAYDRGNEHETANEAALVAEGWVIVQHQREVTLRITDNVEIAGHLDGVIAGNFLTNDQRMVWEAKAPGAWAKFRDAHLKSDWSDPLAHRYAWQISTYMIATGLEAMVTCLDGDEVKSFVIEVPPFSETSIKGRALLIWDTVSHGEMIDKCSQNDWPCPVAYLHGEEEVDTDPEMDRLVTDYHFAGQMIKEWQTKQDRAKEKVEAQLGERQEITTALSKVTRYEQKGATKWDDAEVKTFLMSHGQEPHDFRATGKSSTRIKITQRGASDAVDAE